MNIAPDWTAQGAALPNGWRIILPADTPSALPGGQRYLLGEFTGKRRGADAHNPA